MSSFELYELGLLAAVFFVLGLGVGPLIHNIEIKLVKRDEDA
jgi:hypothetical protein